MTTLPQDLYQLTDPATKTNLPKSETVLPTLRKRWNAPESPKAQKPILRKNSMPTVPNGYKGKGTITYAKSSINVTGLPSQSKLPDCTSNKSLSKVKEAQVEIATLKKEIGTLKAEYSALKVRLRRVEDENAQKTRQIDKLQAEVNSEMINNKKNKENESVSVLRQKCLRLDSALRERDLTIKRFISDLKLTKGDELKEILQKYHREFGLPNGIGAGVFRDHSRLSIQPTETKSPSKQIRANPNFQTNKSETEKLRNYIHKLEAETKFLQTQVKEKDQEIRRLKLQIQHFNARSNMSSTGSLSKISRKSSTPRSSSPVQSKTPNTSSSHLATRRPTRTPTTVSSSTKPAQPKQVKRPISSNALISTPVKNNSTFVIKQSHSVPKCKPCTSKPLSSVEIEKAQLELKVQNMRENAAARKIQKGWRNHKKMVGKDLTKDQEKALTLIFDQLKAHQLRKEKLVICTEENDNIISKLSESDKENVILKVDTIFKTLFGNTVKST